MSIVLWGEKTLPAGRHGFSGIIFYMEQSPETKNEFSLVKRFRSFTHASRGLGIFLKTTHNAWIQIFIFALAIFLSFYFDITSTEWMILTLAGGFVIAIEALNTAFEIDINLTSPEFHPYARDTKDVAAGAVLVSAISALIVGILIFWPYIYDII